MKSRDDYAARAMVIGKVGARREKGLERTEGWTAFRENENEAEQAEKQECGSHRGQAREPQKGGNHSQYVKWRPEARCAAG